jgi:hypothetical protein
VRFAGKLPGLVAANISKKHLLALPNLIVALADYQSAENN